MNYNAGPQIKITDKALMKVPEEFRSITLLAAVAGARIVDRIRRRIGREKRGPDGRPMGPFNNTGGMWRGLEIRKGGGHGHAVGGFYRSSYTKKFFEANRSRLEEEDRRRAERARRKPAGTTNAKKATGAKIASSAKKPKKATGARSKSTANPQPNKPKTWAQQKKAHRVRNRLKALTSQESRTRSTKGRHRMVRRGDVMVLKTEEAPRTRSHGADGRELLGLTRNEQRAITAWIARICERKILTHPDAKPGPDGPAGDPQLATSLRRIARFRAP